MRHFHVTGDALKDLCVAYYVEVDALAAQRKAFLHVWGSNEVLVGSMWGRSVIVGLKDPRPLKALPKGWKKSARNPGFVCPSASNTRKLLSDLSDPQPDLVWQVIAEAIVAVDEAARKYLITEKGKARSWWGGAMDINGMAVYSITLNRVKGDYYIHIPDDRLRFNELVGCAELKGWEWQKVVEEQST